MTLNQEPPAAKKELSELKQDAPDTKQGPPTTEQEKNTPPSAENSVHAEDPLKAQHSKTDTAAMQTVAKTAAESLKNEMQPQVDALWDAVKWMEDHMEAIDADRRQELEDASRAAARNTAKVNSPKEKYLLDWHYIVTPTLVS